MEKERGVFFNGNFYTGIAISSLTLLAASTTPIVGTLITLFTPLPILFFYYKAGRLQGMAILIISLLAVTLFHIFVGITANLPLLYLSGFTGVFLAELLKRNYTIEKTVIYPVATISILWFLFLITLGYHLGKTPWHLIEGHIAENIRESIQIYSQLGISAEQINEIRENATHITQFFTNISPAFVVIGISFTMWINILFARELFHKNKIWYPDFGDLSRWKTPDRLIWLLIIAAGTLLIPVSEVIFTGLNLLLVCLFVYLLQGFSITSFFFKRKKIPRPVRFIFYFVIAIQQYMLLPLIALGIFDLWIDFRKYITPATDTTS